MAKGREVEVPRVAVTSIVLRLETGEEITFDVQGLPIHVEDQQWMVYKDSQRSRDLGLAPVAVGTCRRLEIIAGTLKKPQSRYPFDDE